MKVLVCIAHYGTGQREYLKQVLRVYDRMPFEIDLALFVTDNFDTSEYRRLNINKTIYDKKIGQLLPHQHKKFMAGHINEYDLFIYSEDDILITEQNVLVYIELSKKLKHTPYVPGFMRYEVKQETGDYQYLLDFHPRNCIFHHGRFWMRLLYLKGLLIPNSPIRYRTMVNHEEYFAPTNPHQGCYVLTQDQFKQVLQSGNYFLGPEGGYGGILESAATNVYYRCGITKLIHMGTINDILIHHLPNRYVTSFPHYDIHEVPNVDKLMETVKQLHS